MTYLLDTNVFLWWIADDPRISANADAIMRNPASQVLLSVASAWEIVIKSALGKLRLESAADVFVPRQMDLNRIEPLSVQLNHALRVTTLPHHHRDPFDRLIVAQAQLEGIPILTNDQQIRRYDVRVEW